MCGEVFTGTKEDIYGWIEEQRANLEDLLGLDLFMEGKLNF